MPRIALLTTTETDLLSARASEADYVYGNPAKLSVEAVRALIDGADLIVFRFLGGKEQLPETFTTCVGSGLPLVVLGGQHTPDASLMELSSVPIGVAAQAHHYFTQGGVANLRNVHAFLSDTVLLTGDAFEPVEQMPVWSELPRPEAPDDEPAGHRRPRIGIIFYRAHYAAGNIKHIVALSDAIDAAGGRAVPIQTASLRDPDPGLIDYLGTCDAIITTVQASGGLNPADASAGGDEGAWDVEQLAKLDVPILQGLTVTWSRETWEATDDGMGPYDVATQVAVPEFDGRIITVAFSFKEVDADGLPHYVPDLERCARVAGLAVNHARLRLIPPADRRVAIVLSAYPTKHARIGNAVGLDTPVSIIRLLRAMREAGYDIGAPGEIPGTGELEPVEGEHPDTTAGNALIHAIIAAGGQDEEWLTSEQLSGQPVRIDAATYRRWFAEFPEELQRQVTEAWGEAPGNLFVDRATNPDGEIVAATLQAGNIVILVQPPRGFGENPIAIYHDPDLAPTHHYLATYRWLEKEFGAHAVVHVGKHGNLEWLPGKTLALDSASGPDAALGNLPLIYPFLVNDPGEGTQAKRRAHATIVDHLIPPMARAESYGDISRLEQLLDEYGNVSVMDPAKAPALQGEIWQLIKAAQMHQDLGLDERPDEEEFDEFVMHVDGWLCEIKDVQIRDGLHILSQVPEDEGMVNLVLAILRANQVFGGRTDGVPGLRVALGLPEDQQDVSVTREETDRVEAEARSLVEQLAAADWNADAIDGIVAPLAGRDGVDVAGVRAALEFGAAEVVPRLRQTAGEIPAVLHALDGGYIPAGPSGSPLRGLVNVLPTGRNFYSVDPKAIPSKLAWQTGQAAAENLVARYRQETGEYPSSVGLSVWGTSAMRTSGDDIAEVFALLGIRPLWEEQSRRVIGLEPISLEELGRPRIDVTVRISGFFRDAFPHVVALLDDAVALAAAQEEPAESNFVRAHVAADLESHGDERRARTRIFGSKPGTYGAGMLELIESGNWRTDADLAEVYAAWGGFAYGRDLDGAPARDDMENNYRRIKVAAKNVDSREHDIIDSDDYFQYHGGMVATVRALTGSSPKAYVGDTTIPDAVRTRSLAEETARVFRARVVNPKWLAAMRRHGYKGAFEMAASVDYLFGFDATAQVVGDWMYESVANTYLLDEENQAFLRQANPWALRSMVERLQESVDRGMWENPDPELIKQLHELYLEVEGDLEE